MPARILLTVSPAPSGNRLVRVEPICLIFSEKLSKAPAASATRPAMSRIPRVETPRMASNAASAMAVTRIAAANLTNARPNEIAAAPICAPTKIAPILTSKVKLS